MKTIVEIKQENKDILDSILKENPIFKESYDDLLLFLLMKYPNENEHKQTN